MAKIEKIICDICGEEITLKHEVRLDVIFTTEQDEGRSCNPYISNENLDLCDKCRERVIEGNYIFASGAQGHNSYSFKSKKK